MVGSGKYPLLTNADYNGVAVCVEAELAGATGAAQIVRYDMPEPTETPLQDPDIYHIDLCLTPRPLNTRAAYSQRWGPHRFERVGDVFMIPPGEQFIIKNDHGCMTSLICYLERGMISRLMESDLGWDDRQLASTINVTNARIRATLIRLAEELRHPGRAASQILDYLYGVLAIEIGRYCIEAREAPTAGGLAGWRLRLIDERLNEDLTAPSLQELGALCNISVRQLTRGFRVSRGCTIGEYIDQRRMEAAKRLLMKGDTVRSIASAMGYTAPSTFSFAFRRTVGINPVQFRERQVASGSRDSQRQHGISYCAGQ